MNTLNLQKKQKEVVVKILKGSNDEFSMPWKVLIYDSYGRDILAPLLTVAELRKLGVTLHLSLEQPRQRVEDIPTVYFIVPSQSNIDVIWRDCASSVYEDISLHFTSSISRELLDKLAMETVKRNCVSKINKIFDQYVHFICLEPSVFTLRQENSYYQLYSPLHDKAMLDKYIDDIVTSLLCIFVTLNVIPIIRSQGTGSAAEIVARRLCDRLKKQHSEHGSMFGPTRSRPILLLVDRNLDLASPLHHGFSYQALIHDLLGMSGNRVKVPKSSGDKMAVDLDQRDDFWVRMARYGFEELADEIKVQLSDYQVSANQITSQTTAPSDNPFDDIATRSLVSAIDSLPEIERKKKRLDMHTNIAHALLERLQSRELHKFYEIEKRILSGDLIEKNDIFILLKPEGVGNIQDKIRLFGMCYLLDSLTANDLKTAENYLKESAGVISDSSSPTKQSSPDTTLAELQYLKKMKAIVAPKKEPTLAQQSASVVQPRTGLMGLAGSVINKGVGIIGNVKQFLTADRRLPLTRVLDALLKNEQSQITENFIYLDPLDSSSSQHINFNSTNSQSQSFATNQAVVFVCGGGNYIEYHSLLDYAEKITSASSSYGNDGLSILYGSTEITSPTELMRQWRELALSDQ